MGGGCDFALDTRTARILAILKPASWLRVIMCDVAPETERSQLPCLGEEKLNSIKITHKSRRVLFENITETRGSNEEINKKKNRSSGVNTTSTVRINGHGSSNALPGFKLKSKDWTTLTRTSTDC